MATAVDNVLEWLLPGSTVPSADAERAVAQVAAAWQPLEAQMTANPKLAAVLDPQYSHWKTFYANWQSGNKDVTDVNAVVADVNVARRNAGNFDQSNDPGAVQGIDIEQATPALATAAVVNDAANTIGHMSACQLLGAPEAFCDENGWKMPWWGWAVGAGALGAMGLGVYALYRAGRAAAPTVARVGAAVYAPELYPAIDRALAATTPAGSATTVPVLPTEAVQARLEALLREDPAASISQRDDMTLRWRRGRTAWDDYVDHMAAGFRGALQPAPGGAQPLAPGGA